MGYDSLTNQDQIQAARNVFSPAKAAQRSLAPPPPPPLFPAANPLPRPDTHCALLSDTFAFPPPTVFIRNCFPPDYDAPAP